MRATHILALAGLASLLLPAAARADGALRPVACAINVEQHVDDDGCTPIRGLDDPAFHVTSPDGRFVYAPGRNADAVAVIARDPGTGAFTAVAGKAGCVAEGTQVEGCRPAVGLDRPQGIIISGDGRFVYVAAVYGDALTVFKRTKKTGALVQIGCFQDVAHTPLLAGCTPAEGLDGATNLAISRDGRTVYVAADDADSLSIFSRDPKTGLVAPGGCFRNVARTTPASCAPVPGLDGPRTVVVSRDGRSVYVGTTTSNSVVAFARDPASGALTPAGCVAVPPNATGTPICTPAIGLLNVQFVTISRDGATVYASGTDSSAVVALTRDPGTSTLTPIPAPGGCVGDFTEGDFDCRAAVGLYYPLGIAITRDGAFAYTGSYGSSSIASFTRDPATGILSPFGPCFSADDTNCERMEGIGRAGYVALTPDERYLQVNAPDGDRLLALARLGTPGAVKIRTRRATVAKGAVVLRVSCPSVTVPGGCVGDVHLTVRDLVGGGVINVSEAGPYALAPGRTGKVTITLNPTAVTPGGHARLLAVAVSRDATGDRTAASSALVTVRRP